jgi:hypothetical protein
MLTPRHALIAFGLMGLVGSVLLTSCPGPLPERPQPPPKAERDAAPNVSVEPDATLENAPAVLRLRIRLAEGVVELPEQTRLFAGTLSSYHLGRIRGRDLPATLLEREVPSVTWAAAAGRELVVAPSQPLAPGETYSLASPALGLIAVLSIAPDDSAALMLRAWPPKDAGKGVEWAIFCADAAVPEGSALVGLDPLALRAEIRPGKVVDRQSPGCLHLRSLEEPPEGALLVPPPHALGFALDPAPFLVAPPPLLVPQVCEPDETQFGPGCALVEDDRLILRGPEVETFWLLEAASLTLTLPVASGQRVIVRGLVPASTVEFSVTVLDTAGRATSAHAVVNTRSVQPHVVISEVFADAVGPEPAQEWIELVNDGKAPVDLDRWVLEDVGGAVLLPSHRLDPGAFVLLVSEGFSQQTTWDVTPAPGTALLYLPSLGKNGLANSGEPLLLRSPDRTVISHFPAMPRPKPGVSVARTAPSALDDDPSSFALHDVPGASPGAPNVTLPQ